jgi:hypothetical protein
MRCILFHYLSLLSIFIPNLSISPTVFLIAFSRNERTHPNFVSQAREIEIFCEDCKLAAPLGFFRGSGPRCRLHRLCHSCACALSCLSFERRVLVVFLRRQAAVIGKFTRMYIEYSFPIVRNVIQKFSKLHSSKCEGTVYNSR